MLTLQVNPNGDKVMNGTPEEKIAALERVDDLLMDEAGFLRPVPAATIRALPYAEFWWWMFVRSVHVVPTCELIEELGRILIAPAIELGAGLGGVGRGLGIPLTDSKFRMSPAGLALAIQKLQFPPVYPEDIEELEATKALQKYKPRSVVMAWVPHWEPPPPPAKPWKSTGGTYYGVRDALLMAVCERVVLIGSEKIHGRRPLLRHGARPLHKGADWLISRAGRGDDVMWVWDRKPDARRAGGRRA